MLVTLAEAASRSRSPSDARRDCPGYYAACMTDGRDGRAAPRVEVGGNVTSPPMNAEHAEGRGILRPPVLSLCLVLLWR